MDAEKDIGAKGAKEKKKVKKIFFILPLCLLAAVMLCVAAAVLYRYNVIPHGKYPGERFGIERFVSSVDRDGDGIDDQTDILESVKAYLATEPKYESRYYAGGWPDDGYGVCTDVVARGLLGAGYDLQTLVDEDRAAHPEDYAQDERPDKNIDFRRVRNLRVYFARNAISLTTDTSKIEEWQAGDIVIWQGHVGVISDVRNYKGVPFVWHHANPAQTSYEQDILETFGEIVGHYRISE